MAVRHNKPTNSSTKVSEHRFALHTPLLRGARRLRIALGARFKLSAIPEN